jgi:hypothetical protein
MPRKTPQQKKALSYGKDRRNCYGENSKSSRKNIPKTRAHTHRAYRQKVKQSLHLESSVVLPDELEQQEIRAISVRRKEWKKVPDQPLAQHVVEQATGRKIRENKKVLRKAREASVQQRLAAKPPSADASE